MATTKETVEAAIAAFNAHDRERWMSFGAPDVAIQGGMVQGLDAWGMVFDIYHTAFPDLHLDVHQMVCEGDLCMVVATATGTHTGPLRDPGIPEREIPATGKPYVNTFASYARTVDGKEVEFSLFYDRLDVLRQLGAMPELAAGTA